MSDLGKYEKMSDLEKRQYLRDLHTPKPRLYTEAEVRERISQAILERDKVWEESVLKNLDEKMDTPLTRFVRERERAVRLDEARWWHKRMHWNTGVPCDGTWSECKCIAELSRLPDVAGDGSKG